MSRVFPSWCGIINHLLSGVNSMISKTQSKEMNFTRNHVRAHPVGSPEQSLKAHKTNTKLNTHKPIDAWVVAESEHRNLRLNGEKKHMILDIEFRILDELSGLHLWLNWHAPKLKI